MQYEKTPQNPQNNEGCNMIAQHTDCWGTITAYKSAKIS